MTSKITPNYPSIDDPNFYEKITKKYEYNQFKPENYNPNLKTLFPHQAFMRNFISPETPYNSILLYHSVGTGKTCTSISVAEEFVPYLQEGSKIVVITKNDFLQKGYKEQIVSETCTGNKYMKNEERILASKNPDEWKNTIDKKIGKNYKIYNHQEFSNRVKDGTVTRYKNTVIIVDEVHNMVGTPKFSALKKIIKRSSGTRLVLLTATPMYNEPYEIADIINILRLNDRVSGSLPTGDKFMKTIFGIDGYKKNKEHIQIGKSNITSSRNIKITSTGKELLKEMTKGYISYIKGQDETFPELIEEGDPLYKGSYINVIKAEMSKNQLHGYKKALEEDGNKGLTSLKNVIKGADEIDDKESKIASSLYRNAIAACNIVYKDGTFDSNGEKKHIEIKDFGKKTDSGKYLKKFVMKIPEDYTGKKLEEQSAKMYKVIDNLKKIEKNGTAFIFSNNIINGHLGMVSAILEANGYYRYGSKEKNKGNKGAYLLVTGDSNYTSKKDTQNLIKVFNSPANKDGSKIKIILGTMTMAEGITIKGLRQIHVMEPWWNLSRIDQIIGRGYRANSHEYLDKKYKNIRIYKYVATSPNKEITVEEGLYKYAEDKDVYSRMIERCLKENAVECSLYKERNVPKGAKDGSRLCEYQKCDYKCQYNGKFSKSDIDKSTYTHRANMHVINKVKNIISDMYNQFFVYSIDQIVDYVNEVIKGKIEKSIIYMAIHELVKNQEPITDMYNRDGTLIYTGNVIVLHPINISNKMVPMYYRLKKPSDYYSDKEIQKLIGLDKLKKKPEKKPEKKKLIKPEGKLIQKNIHFQGTYDDKGNFKIMKKTQLAKTKTGTIDKRTQRRGGTVCTSSGVWSKAKLVEVLKDIGVSDKDYNTGMTNKTLCEIIEKEMTKIKDGIVS